MYDATLAHISSVAMMVSENQQLAPTSTSFGFTESPSMSNNLKTSIIVASGKSSGAKGGNGDFFLYFRGSQLV
jgi:hypothetical protein